MDFFKISVRDMKTLRNKCKLHVTEQQQEQGWGDQHLTFTSKNIYKGCHYNPDDLCGSAQDFNSKNRQDKTKSITSCLWAKTKSARLCHTSATEGGVGVHGPHCIQRETAGKEECPHTDRGEESKYLVLNYKPSATGENTHQKHKIISILIFWGKWVLVWGC